MTGGIYFVQIFGDIQIHRFTDYFTHIKSFLILTIINNFSDSQQFDKYVRLTNTSYVLSTVIIQISQYYLRSFIGECLKAMPETLSMIEGIYTITIVQC